ncbi:uncharacterized protein METZ01_LOCUS338265, partial [marine metagenome]
NFTYIVTDGDLNSNESIISVNITPVNDSPLGASIENIEVYQNQNTYFSLENYITDYDTHSNDLTITFLPEETDSENSSIIGSSFYGGTILSIDGDNFTFEYQASTTNTPTEDFILYKISDGELESEPALVSFDIPWGNPGIFRPGANNAVSQLIDTAEDTQTEITFIAFNSDPLDSSNDFPISGDGVEVEVVWGPYHGEVIENSLSLDETTGDYVIMSGGYIPGNNYGDNVGIDEILRDDECAESGLDSLGYIIYNPSIDEYTDTTTITFCVHGVNDPPYLFDLSNKEFDEDTILEIPITRLTVEAEENDIVINSDHITTFDPDTLFNNVD